MTAPRANIVFAAAPSQDEFLAALVAYEGIDWARVHGFHMDEYLGITADHKASFRRYLRERVESLVKPGAFHYINGDASLPLDEIEYPYPTLAVKHLKLWEQRPPSAGFVPMFSIGLGAIFVH